MILTLLLVLGQWSSSPVEFVRPEAYVIKRFEEVLNFALQDRPTKTQEQLIALRAQLVISEQQLLNLRTRANDSSVQNEDRPRAQMLKASQARVDHYRRQIQRLEGEALKSRKKVNRSAPRKK